MFTFCEFVEQMSSIADAFRRLFQSFEDLFREVAKKVEETRTSHKRHRPARISEGFPRRWVVPHS